MGAQGHRLIVAALTMLLLMLADAAALWLVVKINWATLPGPEAGIVSSIITAVVTGISGMAGTVVSFYFGASPMEGPRN